MSLLTRRSLMMNMEGMQVEKHIITQDIVNAEELANYFRSLEEKNTIFVSVNSSVENNNQLIAVITDSSGEPIKAFRYRDGRLLDVNALTSVYDVIANTEDEFYTFRYSE